MQRDVEKRWYDVRIDAISTTATTGRNTTVQLQLICSLQVCLIPLINWSVGSPWHGAYTDGSNQVRAPGTRATRSYAFAYEQTCSTISLPFSFTLSTLILVHYRTDSTATRFLTLCTRTSRCTTMKHYVAIVFTKFFLKYFNSFL